MSGQETETQEAPPPTALPPAPAPTEERDRPLINLRELTAMRKKGQIDIMGYAILVDIMDRREDRREERRWKREEQTSGRKRPDSPEVQGLKTEMTKLQETVNALITTIQKGEDEKAQKQFVESVVKNTTGEIMPVVKDLQSKMATFETTLAEAKKKQPERAGEFAELQTQMTKLLDKLGEKVGSKSLNLSDVDTVMEIITQFEEKFGKKSSDGEVDPKTMAVSMVGEIGKELITAYKEIETARSGAQTSFGQQQGKQQPKRGIMFNTIKRQVQIYIEKQMKAGATVMNVKKAAIELGLTHQQVTEAYQALMQEGWFHVRVPSSQTTSEVTKHEQFNKEKTQKTEIPGIRESTEGEATIFTPT